MLVEPISIKKITILGTTGSGKTSFLEALFGDFHKNDVLRDISVESRTNFDFTPTKHNDFRESTTTISLNVINSLLCLTSFNKLMLDKYINRDQIDFANIDEAYQVVFNDPAGQERFSFMQEIALKGSHLIIIMADGSNISSMEKIVHFIHQVEIEEHRTQKSIPVIVFVNKSDLKDKGVFLGKDVAEKLIFSSILDQNLVIYETSNYYVKTYDEPLRIIFNYLSMNSVTS